MQWLDKTYRKLEPRGEPDAVNVIVNLSRHLIPWLYIADNNVNSDNIDKLEKMETRNIVSLEAGLDTFAEIIMAGIDMRPVAYDPSKNRQGWSSSLYKLEFQPEGGIEDVLDKNIRDDLFKKINPHHAFLKTPEAEKDESINMMLDHLLIKKGIRFYLISDSTDDDSSRRIVSRYPKLAAITLNPKLRLGNQKLLLQMRHLLRLVENNEDS